MQRKVESRSGKVRRTDEISTVRRNTKNVWDPFLRLNGAVASSWLRSLEKGPMKAGREHQSDQTSHQHNYHGYNWEPLANPFVYGKGASSEPNGVLASP